MGQTIMEPISAGRGHGISTTNPGKTRDLSCQAASARAWSGAHRRYHSRFRLCRRQSLRERTVCGKVCPNTAGVLSWPQRCATCSNSGTEKSSCHFGEHALHAEIQLRECVGTVVAPNSYIFVRV
ncbi:unnamed protein product [Symbiodinium microadriaticum]|nr:unnamed protein product [Symbiodinium microadriaticum]